ncbi:MAG: hypothetical protein HYR74_12405 [Candidatus Eisenbacteria bacterium]|nr:hypothetical protein [Candidatus Eisenbacteria bacterium]
MSASRIPKRTGAGIVLIVAGVCAWAAVAGAHVVSDRELRVVAQIPAAIGARIGGAPDTAGYVAPNRAGRAVSLGAQRPATLRLIVAAAHADTAAAERSWRAVELGFRTIRGAPGIPLARDDRAAFDRTAWAGSACRAFIAVMNSGLADRFRPRYAGLKHELEGVMDSLVRRSDALIVANAGRGGALLTIASAFTLAEATFHDERFGVAAKAALAAGLALQRGDGAFTSDVDVDPREHALGLEALQAIVVYVPTPAAEAAASRGAEWLRAHAVLGAAKSRAGATIAAVGPGEVRFVVAYAATPMPRATPIHPTTGVEGFMKH